MPCKKDQTELCSDCNITDCGEYHSCERSVKKQFIEFIDWCRCALVAFKSLESLRSHSDNKIIREWCENNFGAFRYLVGIASDHDKNIAIENIKIA